MENRHSEKELESLILFIREELGEFNLEITEDSILEDDLGLTGDDAIDLIVKYGNEFRVDIEQFDFKKYFHPEPSIFNTYSPITSLTINDLYSGIKTGKLR